jgi:hypothetical protein
MDKEVPIALVRTWIDLARNINSDQKVKNHVLMMLKNVFGSNENLIIYMKKKKPWQKPQPYWCCEKSSRPFTGKS